LGLDHWEIPTYFDPRYACDMTILRFDTQLYVEKYRSLVQTLMDTLSRLPVIRTGREAHPAVMPYPAYLYSQPAGANAPYALAS
jgi:hypothetical protein